MFNMSFFLKNIDFFIKKIKIRDKNFNFSIFFKIFYRYRFFKNNIELLQNKRNILIKKAFFYKNKKNDFLYIKYFLKLIKFNIILNKKKFIKIFNIFNKFFLCLPNIPDDSVPIGIDDTFNKVLYKWGNIKSYKFKLIDHIKFEKKNNLINFSDACMISGSCFSVIKNDFASLYRAISQFMMDFHVENNYSEIYVPYIVKEECLYNTGQLPKFRNNLFYVYSKKYKDKLVLIPTSEVSLVNLCKNKIFNELDLPIKFVSNTPCFRFESKSYGYNNRGLIRLNQFDKVEIIQIVKPNESMKYLEKLTIYAESILKKLDLPYRRVLLSSGSMSFSSSKTYDIEVWSPVSKSYIEVSSCSNTLDFQSRRLNIKYRSIKSKKKIFPHILNGSALAIGRTFVAIIENYQINKNTIKIPDVLVPYIKKKNIFLN